MTAAARAARLDPAHIRAVVDDCYATHCHKDSTAAPVPCMRDRVRVDGYDEIFFVIYVDTRRRTADVVCGQRVGFLSDVPFGAIHPAAGRSAGI